MNVTEEVISMTLGTVDRVEQRTVNTKFGPKPVYDLVIGGTKYSWGFKNPTTMGVTDGAEIEFSFTPDKYGPKIMVDGVVVKTSGTGAPVHAVATDAPSAKGSGTGVGFPVPVGSDKISILRQNALTNARELVMSDFDMFVDESTEDKIVAAILRIASQFSDFTSGRDIEEKVKKLTSKMEK